MRRHQAHTLKGGNKLKAALMAREKRNDTTVKVDADVIRKLRYVASHREITLAKLLSDILKPIADKEFEQFKKQLNKEG